MVFLLTSWAVAAQAGDPTPGEVRRGELVQLIRQDCGACHGMRLTGGLGPAITAAALKDKPASSLKATILDGRPGTAMPPWRPLVSEAEAEWMVSALLRGAVDAR